MDSKIGIIFRKYDGEFLLCFLSSYFGRSSQNSKQSFITSLQLIQAHNKNQGRDSEGLSSMQPMILGLQMLAEDRGSRCCISLCTS